MVNAVAPAQDLCGLCLDPMEGTQVVPHEGITLPSHAIHRECFLDWKRRCPHQRTVCLMMCGGEYIDQPILFEQLHNNPVHFGLPLEERRYLEKKEKLIGVAATVILAGATAASWCFSIKSISEISLFIFRTYITPLLGTLVKSLPGAVLGFGVAGSFFTLYVVAILGSGFILAKLAEKVGYCFRRFPADGHHTIIRAMGGGVFGTFQVSRILIITNLLTFNAIAISITAITAIAAGVEATAREF